MQMFRYQTDSDMLDGNSGGEATLPALPLPLPPAHVALHRRINELVTKPLTSNSVIGLATLADEALDDTVLAKCPLDAGSIPPSTGSATRVLCAAWYRQISDEAHKFFVQEPTPLGCAAEEAEECSARRRRERFLRSLSLDQEVRSVATFLYLVNASSVASQQQQQQGARQGIRHSHVTEFHIPQLDAVNRTSFYRWLARWALNSFSTTPPADAGDAYPKEDAPKSLYVILMLLSAAAGGRMQRSGASDKDFRGFLEFIVASCSYLPPFGAIVRAVANAEVAIPHREQSPAASSGSHHVDPNERQAPQSSSSSSARRREVDGAEGEDFSDLLDLTQRRLQSCSSTKTDDEGMSVNALLWWARCGLLAVTMLPSAAVETMMRGGSRSASWFRAAAICERTVSEGLRASTLLQSALESEKYRKENLVFCAADYTRFMMHCTEHRWHTIIGTPQHHRSQPGGSILHLLMQVVGDDAMFVRSNHTSLRTYAPYGLVLRSLMSVNVTEGRLRQSLYSVLLDVQRGSPTMEPSMLLRTLHSAVAAPGRGGAAMWLQEGRRGEGPPLHHLMEEGFVNACSVSLLLNVTAILQNMTEHEAQLVGAAACSNESAVDGPMNGYPLLPEDLDNQIFSLQSAALQSLEILRSVVLVSQHHSTNPVTFMLTPQTESHVELCTSLVQLIARFGRWLPVLTASTLTFLATCVHHNVRDVVPALLERNVLPAVYELLTPSHTLGHYYHPLVRLACVPLLQAFSVYQASRNDIEPHAICLCQVFDGLVECMRYPSPGKRMTLGSERRDWPSRLPSDFIAWCAKDCFLLLKDLNADIRKELLQRLVSVMPRLDHPLSEQNPSGTRQAMEQLVDFFGSVPSFSSGGRERDLSPGFGLRRGDQRSTNVSSEMQGLQEAGFGQSVLQLVVTLIDTTEPPLDMPGDSAVELPDTPAQPFPNSLGVFDPPVSPTNGQQSSSKDSGALGVTLTTLIPLMTRITPDTFAVLSHHITKRLLSIIETSAQRRSLLDVEGRRLVGILSFVTTLPENRRLDHVTVFKEQALAMIHDAYCQAVQMYSEQTTTPAVEQQEASDCPPPIIGILQGDGNSDEAAAAAVANSSRARPSFWVTRFMDSMRQVLPSMVGNRVMRVRPAPPAPNDNRSTTTYSNGPFSMALDRTLEELKHHIGLVRHRPATPHNTMQEQDVTPQAQTRQEVEEDALRVLRSCRVRLQSTSEMLGSTPGGGVGGVARFNAMNPGGSLININLVDVSSVMKILTTMAEQWVPVCPPVALTTSPGTSGEESTSSAPPSPIGDVIIDIVACLAKWLKVMSCGNRLLTRDHEMKRDLCQFTHTFFTSLVPRRLFDLSSLSSVVQLITVFARESLFQAPPSSTSSTSPMLLPRSPTDAVLGPFQHPLDRSGSPGLMARFHLDALEQSRRGASISHNNVSTQSVFENARTNVLCWIADAIGPLSVHCHLVDSMRGKDGAVPSNSSHAEDEMQRAATQIMYAAFGSPHYRESLFKEVGKKAKESCSSYTAFFRTFGICISQKGNLPLRKAIACASDLPHLLLKELANQTEILAAFSKPPTTCVESEHVVSVQRRLIVEMSITLKAIQSLVSFLTALQFPASPLSVHHHHHGMSFERVCDHHQNGFCWYGCECPSIHTDSMTHLRSSNLETGDRHLVDCLNDAMMSTRPKVPTTVALQPPAFITRSGCSLLDGPLVQEVITVLVSVLKAAAQDSDLFVKKRGGYLMPPVSQKCTSAQIFLRVVTLLALQLPVDEYASQHTLRQVPLEVFCAFDKDLNTSAKETIAQIIRYSLEDHAIVDTLMYKGLLRVAEGLLVEDGNRESLTLTLTRSQVEKLLDNAVLHAQMKKGDNEEDVLVEASSQETVAALMASAFPSVSVDGSLPKVHSSLFVLSELLRDFVCIANKFPISASKIVARHCIPAEVTGPFTASPPPPVSTRYCVWISPNTLPPQHTTATGGGDQSSSKQHRHQVKSFFRAMMDLAAEGGMSKELAATILSEIANLPQVQSVAFSKTHRCTHGHQSQMTTTTTTWAASPSSPPTQATGQWSSEEFKNTQSVFIFTMLSIPHSKATGFLAAVAGRNPKQAVEEWLTALDVLIQHEERMLVSHLIVSMERLIRSGPGRDRIMAQLSRSSNVALVCKLVVDRRDFYPEPPAHNSLLSICAMLKISTNADDSADETLASQAPATANQHGTEEEHNTAMRLVLTDALHEAEEEERNNLLHDNMIRDTDMLMQDEEPPQLEDGIQDEDVDEDEDTGEGRHIALGLAEQQQVGVAEDVDDEEEEDEHDEEVDEDDNDEDDGDNDEDDGDDTFMDGFAMANPIFADDDYEDVDMETDFRADQFTGADIELRILARRGEIAELNHDPEFIRELLYRAHVASLTGSESRTRQLNLREDGTLFVHRSAPNPAARAAPTINPDETAAVLWQHAMSNHRVVRLENTATLQSQGLTSSAERLMAPPRPSSIARAFHTSESHGEEEDDANDLILRLFGAASTRTPSQDPVSLLPFSNLFSTPSQDPSLPLPPSDPPIVLPAPGALPAHPLRRMRTPDHVGGHVALHAASSPPMTAAMQPPSSPSPPLLELMPLPSTLSSGAGTTVQEQRPQTGSGEESITADMEPPHLDMPWDDALDPQFLAELPAELRREILREHYPILTVDIAHPHAVEGRPPTTTRFHPLFLAALPSDLQAEVLELESELQPPAAVPQVSQRATGGEAGQSAAATASEQEPVMSEALLLLMQVGDDPTIRRDILSSCPLSELVGDAAIHAEALQLREQQRVEREAQRQRQEEARRREEFARREAERRAMEARFQARQAQMYQHRVLRGHQDDDDIQRLRQQRDRYRRQKTQSMMVPSTVEQLATSPLPLASAVSLFRLVSSGSSQLLLARLLSNILEGHSLESAMDVVHSLLNVLDEPLSATALAFQARAASTANARGNGEQGLGERPSTIATDATGAADEDQHMILASVAARILHVVTKLVARCRTVALAFCTAPTTTGMETDSASSASLIFSSLSPEEVKYIQTHPLMRCVALIRRFDYHLDVLTAFEKLLEVVGHAMSSFEADSTRQTPSTPAASASPLFAQHSLDGPRIRHPRHVHDLVWSAGSNAPIVPDHRHLHSRLPQGASAPVTCNLCHTVDHRVSYRCEECHGNNRFYLCIACALDVTPAQSFKTRIARFGYWSLIHSSILTDATTILDDPRCREETAVRIIHVLSRGIRLCAAEDAPSAEPLETLETVLTESARRLMRAIRDALRRLQAEQQGNSGEPGVPVAHTSSEKVDPTVNKKANNNKNSSSQLKDTTAPGTATQRDVSRMLSALELEEDVMRQVYVLFLPYAETRRPLTPEIRNMWHASKLYLSEVSNVLSMHPNRLRAALPSAIFPLVNGYAQFHLLYGSGDTESMGGMCRTETERLLSEQQTDLSNVSEAAVALVVRSAQVGPNGQPQQQPLQQQQQPMEPLPPSILRFCESNRTLINTLIHWDPSLLDHSFKFISRAPRLVDLDFKMKSFRKRCNRRAAPLSITVNRLTCFQDSFKVLKDVTEPSSVHIRFQGEEGTDAGGVGREWFQLMGEEMINDNYALFVHSSEGQTYQPNPCSGVNSNHLEYFRVCGIVVGLAVYNDTALDIHFTRSVYRHMVGMQPCFRDVESIDPVVYTNLEKLLTMPPSALPDLCLDFTVCFERFGRTEVVELIPNGSNIFVTCENLKEYIKLRSAFLMTQQIEPQLRAFLSGFYQMIPREDIRCFTEQELELVISGLPDIDVEDLRIHTEYSGYHASSPIIRWFWEIVAGMTRQDRANLLQFATGSSKVPHGGFANLESAGNRHPFSITKVDMGIELLPQAHTCFNRIDLPDYPTSDILREKLMLAITYGNKGFTMA